MKEISGFEIGDCIQLGDIVYQITSKDFMYYYLSTTLATLTSTVQKFDADLEPNREFLYHIIRCAVDGYLEFQLQYPEGVPHWTPHGNTIRLNNINAGYPMGIIAPMMVMNPYYPAYNVYNPKSYEVTADFWFWGWKYTVKQLKARPAQCYVMTDYARGGGGG